VRTIREEPFTPSAWFVLGRNLYQAACGNSQKAMDFMGNLEAQLRQLPDETAKHLLSGMLYEIYFDGHGKFRESAKFSYADKPLAVVTLRFTWLGASGCNCSTRPSRCQGCGLSPPEDWTTTTTTA